MGNSGAFQESLKKPKVPHDPKDKESSDSKFPEHSAESLQDKAEPILEVSN